MNIIQTILLHISVASLFLMIGMLIGRMIYQDPKITLNYPVGDKSTQNIYEENWNVSIYETLAEDTIEWYRHGCKVGDMVKCFEMDDLFIRTGRHTIYSVKSKEDFGFKLKKVATVK